MFIHRWVSAPPNPANRWSDHGFLRLISIKFLDGPGLGVYLALSGPFWKSVPKTRHFSHRDNVGFCALNLPSLTRFYFYNGSQYICSGSNILPPAVPFTRIRRNSPLPLSQTTHPFSQKPDLPRCFEGTQSWPRNLHRWRYQLPHPPIVHRGDA